MRYTKRLTIPFLLIIALLATGLSGCSSSNQHEVAVAAMDGMPERVHAAPVRVQEAYQYAVANPDILQHIPCYCGCGAMGHTSNYSCYVVETDAQGAIVYDEHALDCGICVDISQDAMRLQTEGKDVAEIFSFIDNRYARFGPPTPLEKLN